MDIKAPLYIKVTTDDNVMKFVRKEPKGKNRKEDGYIYLYIKSSTKSGEIEFGEKYFKKMLEYSFKEINEDEI